MPKPRDQEFTLPRQLALENDLTSVNEALPFESIIRHFLGNTAQNEETAVTLWVSHD